MARRYPRGRLLIAALAVALCTAAAALLAPQQVTGTRERVRGQAPEQFPVAVVYKGAPAALLPLREAPRDGDGPADWTFLVADPVPDGVTMEASSEGKQSLRVERRLESGQTAVGWYNATEKEVFPQYFELRRQARDPQAMLRCGAVAFLLSTAVAAIAARRAGK